MRHDKCALPEERSRAAAFPRGDLPGDAGRRQLTARAAALSRFAMARANYFPPPPRRSFCQSAEARCIFCPHAGFASRSKIVGPLPSSASLRPLRVRNRLRLRQRDRREGRDQRGRSSGQKGTRHVTPTAPISSPKTTPITRTAHRLRQRRRCSMNCPLRPPPGPGRTRSAALPEPDAVQGQLDTIVETSPPC